MRSDRTIPSRVLLSLLGVLLAAPVAAAGRWQAFVRPEHYTDLLAIGDTVWCGTLESGLLRYLRSSGSFTSFNREPGGIASNKVTALAFDRGGRLWVGTSEAGVSRLDPDRKTWGLLNRLDGLPSTGIKALRAQGDTLWIGTDAGLAFWNGTEIAGCIPDGVNPSPFSSDVIVGIVPLGDSLWVATSTGIYVSHFSTQLSEWKKRNGGLGPSPNIRSLVWDGTTLMALDSSTPWSYSPSDTTWFARFVKSRDGTAHPADHISDHYGVIVASSIAGIYRWDSGLNAWVPVDTVLVGAGDAGPGSPLALVASVDDSGHYAAANVTGLYLGSENVLPWIEAIPPAPPSNDIINLGLDGDYVYANSNGAGVGRLDGHDWKLWLSVPCGTCDTTLVGPSFPFALLVDRQRRKWIGTWDVAVESFDDFATPPTYKHLWRDSPGPRKHTWAWASAADLQGGRWFGMDTPCLGGDPVTCDPLGLDYYDADRVFRRSYNAGNTAGFRFNKVHSLTVSDDGYVWVGFSPDGVVRFTPPTPTPSDSSYDIALVSVDAVPPTSFVEGLVARGTDVWALTDKGLLRVDRLNPATLLATHALPGAVNKIGLRPLDVGPDGTVWAGTESGVRAFYANGDSGDFNTANSALLDNSVRAICVDQRTGVVWFGTGGGLSRYDPNYISPPSAPPTLGVKIFPNPAMITTGGLNLRLGKKLDSDPGGIYRGAVYDVSGRRMRTFQVNLAGPTPQVFWNGRDSSGNLARSGIYFVRVEAGGRACTVRVALVR